MFYFTCHNTVSVGIVTSDIITENKVNPG